MILDTHFHGHKFMIVSFYNAEDCHGLRASQ
jgi:hypothetical protein